MPQKSQVWPLFSFVVLIALAGLVREGNAASVKIPTSIWHVQVAGQDSLFNEGLARDLSQSLAEDTAVKVFDARRRGSGLLDSLFARNPYPAAITLRDALPNGIELAIRVSCRMLDTRVECRTEGRFILGAAKEVIDTGFYALDAVVKRRLFAACIMRRWRKRWHGISEENVTKLTFKYPASPARLLRDLEILSEGSIAEMQPGTELETGDMGNPALAQQGGMHYVFYPKGRYAYPMPHVMQVVRGKLGLWQMRDTSSIAGVIANSLIQSTRLDSANLLWRTLGQAVGSDSSKVKSNMAAWRDSAVWLTPSCVIRGRPKLAMIRHEGSETLIELVQGEIAVLPLLSSREAVLMLPLQQGSTRGFSIDTAKMSERRSEKLSTELTALASSQSGLSLGELLPARLFNRRRTHPVLSLEVQEFLAGELRGVDAAPRRLGPPAWDAFGTLNPMSPGKNEAGCYLCRPDRLGP